MCWVSIVFKLQKHPEFWCGHKHFKTESDFEVKMRLSEFIPKSGRGKNEHAAGSIYTYLHAAAQPSVKLNYGVRR